MSWAVPTLHPARLLRDPTMASVVVHDLTKLIRIQMEGPTLLPKCERDGREMPEWATHPALWQVVRWFEARRGQRLAVDIECTFFDQIMCVGFWSVDKYLEDQGLCVPFACKGGKPYWSPHDELEVKQLLVGVLHDAAWPKVGQNFLGFDAQVLNRVWGTKLTPHRPWEWGFVMDTMVAHHCVMPAMPHGLDYLSSLFTDMGPYKAQVHERVGETKDDFSKFENILDYEDRRLRVYCLKDVFATSAAAVQIGEMMKLEEVGSAHV